MVWCVIFYVLAVIVTSGLAFVTGNWKHLEIAAVGVVLLVAWWGISRLLRTSGRR